MALILDGLLKRFRVAKEVKGQVPVFRRATPPAARKQATGFVPIGLTMRTAMGRDPNRLPGAVPRSALGQDQQNLHHSAR